MSTNPSESDDDPTLYDPPAEHAEPGPQEDEQQTLELEIPRELANQLLEVAQHLGLHPDIVASRAVGLICDEIGLVEDDLSSGALIQKYQSRLDLLHNVEYDIQEEVARVEEELAEEDDEEFGWEDVDQIIEQGARSAPEGEAPSLAAEDADEASPEEEAREESFTPELPTAELDQDDIPTDEEEAPDRSSAADR